MYLTLLSTNGKRLALSEPYSTSWLNAILYDIVRLVGYSLDERAEQFVQDCEQRGLLPLLHVILWEHVTAFLHATTDQALPSSTEVDVLFNTTLPCELETLVTNIIIGTVTYSGGSVAPIHHLLKHKLLPIDKTMWTKSLVDILVDFIAQSSGKLKH